ncbi:MAG: hypothetical protein WAK94_12175 [Steroidobacteraceae bacterium]
MWLRAAATGALAALALAALAARAADPPSNAQDPNAGFLEFLGSVDRLSDVNPDYLSQADAPKAAQAPPGAVRPAQTQPPPPPPPASNPIPPGVKNNG